MKKLIALILSAVLLIPAGGSVSAAADQPVVYFTSDISPDGMMDVYQALNWKPTGNVAVKLSTGEPPASNYLRPELIKDLVQSVKGTIVECNTAYGGSRAETAMHMQVAKDHGFTAIADVDILDADGSMELPVRGGSRLSENLVGSHFKNYDSYIVLSHFKGHAMAGFGGAIKNISIGLGSREGKCLIHTGGRSHTSPWGGDQTAFTESMAEAGKSVSDYLGNGKRIVYVNVLNNISIDCDCDGNPAEPDIHDIGILASTDPVAIDQASIDLCFDANGSGSLQRRVRQQNGLHTLEHAQQIGLGSRTYNLKDITGDSGKETEDSRETESKAETPKDPPSTSSSEKKAERSAKNAMAKVKIANFKAARAGKRKITVSWKKVSKAKGYQVQIATARSFKSSSIIYKKFLSESSLNVSKGRLKSGKTYYVRVRAYTTYKKNGKTVKAYSAWNTGSGKVKL